MMVMFCRAIIEGIIFILKKKYFYINFGGNHRFVKDETASLNKIN